MKRSLILTLAALSLSTLLCACSATGTVDPYSGYSNVSTTHDGRVNGTNGNSYTGGATNGRTYTAPGAQTPAGSGATGAYARGSGSARSAR